MTTVSETALSEFLEGMAHRGIRLWAEDGRLRYRAPAGAVDDRLRADIRELRPQLLQLLERAGSHTPARATPAQATMMPAPDLAHVPFPMTDIQQAYWAGETGFFELGGVRAHIYLEFERPNLDVERLTAAWRRLVERHGMLRAAVDEDGQLRVLEHVPEYRPTVHDARDLEPAEARALLARTRETMAHEGPSTDAWPLFDVRVHLADRMVPTVHVSVSLLVCDALSTMVLLRELETLYEDPAADLEPIGIGFHDYARALERSHDGDEYQRARKYWLDRVAELPPAPELPLGRSPADLEHAEFTRHCQRLPRETWRRFKYAAAQHGVTPSAALLTGYAETLRAWSKNPRFTVNVLHSARGELHPDIGKVVGNFSSTLLVEIEESRQETSFADRARSVQRQLWEGLEHGAFSGVRVLGELNQSRDQLSRAAMPVTFASALYVSEQETDQVATGWLSTLAVSRLQTPQVWLDHQVFEEDGELVANWDVVADVFPPDVPELMFAAYLRLLDTLAEGGAWEAAVPDLLPAEQRAARLAYNATEAELPDVLLHTGFLERAAETPDAVAVITSEATLTYAELERRSAAVTAWLAERGIGHGDLVAVVMEKGWEQITAVLGILRTGAAYVPIDPDWPTHRRNLILTDCNTPATLTQSWIDMAGLPPETVAIAVDSLPELTDAKRPVIRAGAPEDLAYVIFTSGSTGRPKGVAINHRGAANTVLDINTRYSLGPDDRVFGISALTFDLSVWDIFGPLSAGGALVLPDAGALRDPAHWCESLSEHAVTIWNSAPALMQLVAEYAEVMPGALPVGLRVVLLSGDWIPVTLPDRLHALLPDLHIVSLGGATEGSIWSIAHDIDHVDPQWRSIPYGRPLTNQHMYILDTDMRERPDWTIGEIHIGGTGVALGYWNDPQRTTERFTTHPTTGERLYRTGDLGRHLPTGTIEFLGREDFQVKIQGYRIELEEIETALLEHPSITAAIVTATGDPHTTRHLTAHLTTNTHHPNPHLTDELRHHTRTKLPTYMVPTVITTVEALPLTANGKVDRSAVAAWARAGTQPSVGTQQSRPPRDDLERTIAAAWAEVLGLPDVDAGRGFLSCGGQSLSAIRLTLRLERELCHRIPAELLFRDGTVADVADAIRGADSACVDEGQHAH
ncbi:non-ribosomal peptide synthetase [Streptomyces sp. BA2]|uniref:non-ribosomal peptide synthetase n=1 Tax=Streptomyces sp. BA2 TaxID=436595 RepID=UPI001329638F|nr:non-ribosomal peptide synthetase [Streptomyces sp. BA2]MWA16242.1 amino acid adenylation domain-containing protein [Streptomyces sp. BA2]